MGSGELFPKSCPIVGMVHLPPLPGSPGNALTLEAIGHQVQRDVDALLAGGVDGLMVENLGDAPYFPRRVPPETVACMTVLARMVREATDLPLGINVLRNDGFSAIAVAAAVGAEFVRVNVFTGARLTDQGVIEGEASELLRYRRALGVPVNIFADVQVKHSAAIASRSLEDEIDDTVTRGRADAVIVSGTATGKAADIETLQCARAAAGVTPLFIGSGVTVDNVVEMAAIADGLIVGTTFKREGDVSNPVDEGRVRAVVERLDAWRAERVSSKRAPSPSRPS